MPELPTAEPPSVDAPLMLALDAARIGSFSWDLQTQRVKWSRAHQALWGSSDPAGDVALDAFTNRLHPDDVERVMAALKRSEHEHTPFREEFRVRWHDGSVHWMLSAGAFEYDGAHARCMRGVVVEVTTGALADQERAAHELRQRLMLDTLPQAVFLSSGTHNKVEYVNSTFTKLFGYTVCDVPTIPIWMERAYPDPAYRTKQIEDTTAEVMRTIDDPSFVVRMESRVRCADGTEKDIVWTYIRLPDLDLAFGCGQDVTEERHAEIERRRLEEQLRVSQKLEAIGSLAGGVAHDFNNHLTVIDNYTQFVIDDLAADDPRATDLREVRAAVQRATALTRQLLAFSRKQHLAPERLDLNDVIRGLLKMLGRLIGEHITIRPLLADDALAVIADRGSLEQVLMNLVVNARDAMPDGGQITIETRRCPAGEAAGEGVAPADARECIGLVLRDAGTGMDRATQERIFEPFFTTKSVGHGTGLGLSTVHGIVTQSGGTIRVQSELGRGTEFEILLPSAPKLGAASAAALDEPPSLTPVARAHTILVVDDDQSVLDAVVRALGNAGYRVLGALGGEQALRLFERAEAIQLLLTDIVMPGSDGRELAVRVRAMHPEVRVLFMTGYTDNEIGQHASPDDSSHWIDKPFTAEQLVRVVDRVLARPQSHT